MIPKILRAGGGAEGSGRELEAGVDGTGVEEMPDDSRSLLIIAYLELFWMFVLLVEGLELKLCAEMG